MKDSKKGVAKSLLLTLLGGVLFLVEIPGLESSVFVFLVDEVERILAPVLVYVLFAFILSAFLGTILGTVFRLPFIMKSPRLKRTFAGRKMQLVTLTVASFVMVSYLFLPLNFLNQESAALMSICGNMIVFMLIAKMILPLVSDYGLAEILEVYLRPVMKPLLKVPGSAVISLLTSMLVSVTVAVVAVTEQFRKAVYNKKEAVIIVSCMTIPSMPFTMLVLGVVGRMDVFGKFYLYLGAVCLLVSVITVRLFPVRRMPETYYGDASAPSLEVQSGSRWKRAMEGASRKALATRYHPVDNAVGITLNMVSFIPYTLAWGTLMKLLLAYTDLVTILTYPYGLWLKLFGIEEGIQLAPVLVLNFIDVVMPTVLLTDVGQTETVLKVLCMTLGEMVYTAPLLIALAAGGMTRLKEQMGIWLVRAVLLVPAAVLLYPVFF